MDCSDHEGAEAGMIAASCTAQISSLHLETFDFTVNSLADLHSALHLTLSSPEASEELLETACYCISAVGFAQRYDDDFITSLISILKRPHISERLATASCAALYRVVDECYGYNRDCTVLVERAGAVNMIISMLVRKDATPLLLETACDTLSMITRGNNGNPLLDAVSAVLHVLRRPGMPDRLLVVALKVMDELLDHSESVDLARTSGLLEAALGVVRGAMRSETGSRVMCAALSILAKVANGGDGRRRVAMDGGMETAVDLLMDSNVTISVHIQSCELLLVMMEDGDLADRALQVGVARAAMSSTALTRQASWRHSAMPELDRLHKLALRISFVLMSKAAMNDSMV